MPTATERADWIARHVIAAAQQDNACVVTSALVDTVMKMHADTEHGKANEATLRRLIRARAAAEGVRVILTDDERYWAIREQLHHMSGDQVHALRDSIADGGEDDPRGHDQVLVDAISVRLSNRVPPRRLDGVEPVSVRLWDEGPVPDTEQSPAYAMRTVNGGTPERIELDAARREVRWAMTEEGRKGVRALSGVGDVATITYTDVRGVVELRPATAEEAAMVVKPEAERYAPGDRVIVRGVYYRPETRTHHVLPEYEGTVVNWHAGHYNVRAVEPDEDGTHGVRQCRVRELRPADSVGVMREHAQHPGVVEALEILRAAEVPVATVPARKVLYRDWHSPQGPQGAFIWPGAGRTLEVSWFIDGADDERSMRSRDTRTVRAARNQALDDVASAFRGAGWTVWRVRSRKTATRRDLRVDVTPPAAVEPPAVS
jgi:hypothetical protein